MINSMCTTDSLDSVKKMPNKLQLEKKGDMLPPHGALSQWPD